MTELLIHFYLPHDGTHWGFVIDGQVHDISKHLLGASVWLQGSVGRVKEAITELESAAKASSQLYPLSMFENYPSSDLPHLISPFNALDVWAAGVTYERSRAARQEEAVDGGDIYTRVYSAERPELFFKAHGRDVVHPFGDVGIRSDATWSVPEPELGVVLNPALEVVGFTVGNDMSSRDIEGANPLYLPQAKVYNRSCALGPGILFQPSDLWPDTMLRIDIQRGGHSVFSGDIHTSRIKRQLRELVDYLGRSYNFPNGVVLLTGTGIVPPAEFTLAEGDLVRITIDGIGKLVNTVKVV